MGVSGRKKSVKRVRDLKLVTENKRVKGSISFLYCFKKGFKFSIVGIFPLLLQSQMQYLASSRTKLIVALFLELSGIRPKTTRLLRRQSLDILTYRYKMFLQVFMGFCSCLFPSNQLFYYYKCTSNEMCFIIIIAVYLLLQRFYQPQINEVLVCL